MTLYLFYYKPLDEYVDIPPRLYAYTEDKNYADEFKRQRNMEKFIYVKQENVKKDEYRSFSSRYVQFRLSYGKFYTSSVDMFGKRVPVDVLCTWKEEESILKNSDDLWKEYSKYLFDCRIFKSDYIKALEKLLFVKVYGFYHIKYIDYADSFYQPYYSSYGPVEELIMDEFKNDFSYDDLKLFLKFFQNTFDNFKEET
jgi:hypothetical protein